MKKQVLGAAGILAVGLVAGSALSINAANAADNNTTSSSSSSSSNGSSSTSTPSAPTTAPNFGSTDRNAPDMFSATPVRSDEKAVSADVAAKLTAAALAKYSGATVIRAETDGDGAAYEVHLKKADGSVVTVKFDSSYNITSTEDGFGAGPNGAHGGPGDHDGDGPAAGQTPTTSNGSTTNG